ncbi:hypothetical protein OSL55_29385, partial [Escherichia coli]|nr:hypothetical protein [Escherichia coli]
VVGVFVVEPDSVQTVFFHSMGQDLGELCGLGIVHVGDTDALPVAQHCSSLFCGEAIKSL